MFIIPFLLTVNFLVMESPLFDKYRQMTISELLDEYRCFVESWLSIPETFPKGFLESIREDLIHRCMIVDAFDQTHKSYLQKNAL